MMKSTNTTKLNAVKANKAMKAAQAKENVHEVAVEVINDNVQAVYNGTIGLQELLKITDKCIDMTKCENPITVMQKIYSAGSKVGQVTIQGQNMYMIDVTTEEGFATFKDGLKELKVRDSHTPYESVWIEGYNMFKNFNFATGQHYVYYVVTNEEMSMLQDRIVAMSKDKMTVEDAKALQADLPPFVRAWQESSIDVSKDKDKVFDIAMDKILGQTKTLSQLTKKFKDDMDFGFDAVKRAKHLGKDMPAFKYTNATVEAANPVVDAIGNINVAMIDTTIDNFNGDTAKMYSLSNNNAYEKFIDDASISKELAYFIKGIYSICYASKNENKRITKEDYALYRNAIYTAAAVNEVAAEDVIRIAIATAMSTVYKNKEGNIITKDADVNRFNEFPVANIFPNEFFEARTEIPAYEIFKPEDILFDVQRDIEDGEEITFVNGVSEDGMIELVDDFSGTLIEDEGKFYHFIDTYAYEEVNVLLSERTFREGATTAELKALRTGNTAACDNGEFFRSILDENKERQVEINGANANLLLTAHNNAKAFVCQFMTNCEVAKGQTFGIKDVKTYMPANGTPQTFLIVLA